MPTDENDSRPKKKTGGRLHERPDTPLCGFRRRVGGRPCRNHAGWRTDHPGIGRCYLCGGRSEVDRAAGQAAIARAAVDTYGAPRQVGPHEALLEEVWRTAGHVAFLEEQIHGMERSGLITSRSMAEAPAVNGRTDAGRLVGEVSTWVKLYQSERAHLVSVCRTAIDCGIAERQVRIAEEQGRVIAGVIAGVLGDFGVAADADEVRQRVREHLTMIAAAGGGPMTSTATTTAASAAAGAARRGERPPN